MNIPVAASFFFFGLLNNFLYVVILSAAIDLVGTQTPKSVVLLANVAPSLFVKVSGPFYVHRAPYKLRIAIVVVFNIAGMLVVALAPTISGRLLGVAVASACSGLGELTFLQLTHFYPQEAINGFSSGTGAAGLVGSALFMFATTILNVSSKTTLALFSLAPLAFVGVYARLLPRRSYQHLPAVDLEIASEPVQSSTLQRMAPLMIPFVVPLTVVYFAEYTINQGISPTLLFPIESTPFDRYRDLYVAYGTLYQVGVFVSRSSAPWFRVRRLYLPAVLQLVNLGVAILQSLYMVIPGVHVMFLFFIYEGLLGGLAYVNTYMLLSETAEHSEREFAMGTVTMSDSLGIVVAGVLSLWLEPSLCGYQRRDGREWCRLP